MIKSKAQTPVILTLAVIYFLVLAAITVFIVVSLWPELSQPFQVVGATGTFLGVLILIYQLYRQRRATLGEAYSSILPILFSPTARIKRRKVITEFAPYFQSECEKIWAKLKEEHPSELHELTDVTSFLNLETNKRDLLAKNLNMRNSLLGPLVEALDAKKFESLDFTLLGAAEDVLADLESVILFTRTTGTIHELKVYFDPVIRDVWRFTADFIELQVACRRSPDYKRILRDYVEQYFVKPNKTVGDGS